MQIVPRKIAVFAMAKLRELNPSAADQLSLNQLHQAIEFGTTTVMSGPDAPQPQHGKILAAAAKVMQIVNEHQNTRSLMAQSAGRMELADQIRDAFADTDPVALSKLLQEKGA